MLDFMIKGGPFMWVILAASIASLAIVIERVYILWFRFRLDPEHLRSQIMSYVDDKKYSRAVEVCDVEGGHPLAQVLKAGLLKANESDKDIQRAMEAETLKAAPKITKRIPYLSMLANVSTLLGLLGTIQGLVQAFEGVAQADAAAKQDILAKGISVAMYTTAFGLLAAIPSIVAYTLLQSRQNSMLGQLESVATDVFNYLSERNRRLTK